MSDSLLNRMLLGELRELATGFRLNATALTRDAEADKMQSPELFGQARIWVRAAAAVEKIIAENETT